MKMKRLKIILVIAVFIIAVFVGIGYLLPVDHETRVSREFNAAPRIIYRLIRDFRSYAEWRSGVESVKIVDENTWQEIDSQEEAITFGIIEEKAPEKIVTKILDEDLPFGGTWSFELAKTKGKTKLTITERGQVYNPVFRFISALIIGHTATMDTYVRDLERKLSDGN